MFKDTQRLIKIFWIVLAAPFVVLLALLGLTAIGVFGKLPTFEELENPQNNVATEIISEEGKMLGTYNSENGTFVSYADLPTDVVAALVSTEDVRYYGHSGIDFISLARVAFRTIGLGQSQGGGSTITQQLAKNLFKRKGWIVTDKLKEWITAIKLEYNYTKEEIITMYLNTVFYGSGAYGIKNAAHTFFNKSPEELNVQEAATLVGVVNAQTRYNPVNNYDNSIRRRNTVMRRMQHVGYLSRAQYDSLATLPIELDFNPVSHDSGSGTYFREMLRLVMQAKKPVRGDYRNEWDFEYALNRWETNPIYGWLHKNKKADGSSYDLFSDGLKIYTTINASMQRYAEESVDRQIRDAIQPYMDEQFKRTGVVFWDQSPKQVDAIVGNAVRYSDRYFQMQQAGASKSEIEKAFDTPRQMRLYTYRGVRDTLISPRDSVIHFKKLMRASFVAIDPNTGNVRAYVGGPNFRYFKYDNATQAKRQPGSTIKPFVYTFAFSQLEIDPCTPVPNLPVTIETTTGTPWTPKEAGNVEYDGAMHPLKWGLQNSRNNYTAWIMKQAKAPEAVADFLHDLGIRSWIDPVYALALGTMNVSLMELVGAYTTFVSGGMNTEPIFVLRIEDRQGNLISSFLPATNEAISEATAYTTLQVLQDVVNAGTAGSLRWRYGFAGEMGGKTGTSQNSKDAWYVGLTPNLVAGAWVGGEDESVHPLRAGEGSVIALPIYAEFMKRVYADPTLSVRASDVFDVPGGAVRYNCRDMDIPMPATVIEDEFFD